LNAPSSLTDSQATISTFVVHILSPKSSIFAIAEVAKGLIRKQTSVRTVPSTSFSLSVSDLEDILEGIPQNSLKSGQWLTVLKGDTGFPAPDLVIVHHCSPSKRSKMPLELHGFPPWQIRLSEIQ
jgi:dehydrodolichyl diphosphate syntase complex subunit NUS1